MADPSENFYYLPVTGRVTVDGTSYALMTFVIDYALNSIPRAQFTLPIGRGVSGSKENSISDAEGFVSQLKAYTKIEAFLTIKAAQGRAAPPGKSPGFPIGKEFRIFKGRTSEPSMKKSFVSSDASLTVDAFGEIGVLAGLSQFVHGVALPNTMGTAPSLVTVTNNQATSNIDVSATLAGIPEGAERERDGTKQGV